MRDQPADSFISSLECRRHRPKSRQSKALATENRFVTELLDTLRHLSTEVKSWDARHYGSRDAIERPIQHSRVIS